MIAIVLAGGKGTRLGEATAQRPKPMVEINSKPLLEYTLSWLKQQGVERAILTLNYLPDSIVQHFGQGGGNFPVLEYLLESSPLGTAGCLSGKGNSFNEPVWIVYGDVFMDLDLHRIWDFHSLNKANMTLVVHPNDHPHDSDLLEVDSQNRVLQFNPKPRAGNPWLPNLVNAGLYLMNPELFDAIPNTPCDFGRDLIPNWVENYAIYAYSTPEYMKDMGTPDRLKKVENDVLRGFTKARNLAGRQSAIFLDRDGVINDDTHFISKAEDFRLFPFAPKAIAAINRSGFLSVVVTNQSVLARNMTTEAGLKHIHNRMETELGEQGAFLDAIYYCPHHPDKGFPEENPELKIDCDCRKPKPGMLIQAAQRFNIDLTSSFMVGDNERDILAGKSAGCTTVGVATGKGMKTGSTQPDLFFPTLLEAVDFILNPPFLPSINALANMIVSKFNGQLTWIRIGGNTGSGKSSLASLLKRELGLLQQPCHIVRLDNWILPSSARRNQPHDWKTAFQLPVLTQDLNLLNLGNAVQAPGYARHPDHHIQAITYGPFTSAVILVEGIPALADELDFLPWDLSLFIEQSEDERKQHVQQLNAWKGLNEVDTNRLYDERNASEYKQINALKSKADICIKRS
ncbi:MAG: HAD-IIIA family hydrolase [Bacteroidetes bacterium]|nr:HAD-IIIA family hydrolase [Bacteroidota bacterium]